MPVKGSPRPVSPETQKWGERFIDRLLGPDFKLPNEPVLARLLSDRDTLINVTALVELYVCNRTRDFAAARKARGSEMRKELAKGLKGLGALARIYEGLRDEPKKQLCGDLIADVEGMLSRVPEAFNAKRLGTKGELLALIDSLLKVRLENSSPSTLALLLQCGCLIEGRDNDIDPETLRKQLSRFRERNPVMAKQVDDRAMKIPRR